MFRKINNTFHALADSILGLRAHSTAQKILDHISDTIKEAFMQNNKFYKSMLGAGGVPFYLNGLSECKYALGQVIETALDDKYLMYQKLSKDEKTRIRMKIATKLLAELDASIENSNVKMPKLNPRYLNDDISYEFDLPKAFTNVKQLKQLLEPTLSEIYTELAMIPVLAMEQMVNSKTPNYFQSLPADLRHNLLKNILLFKPTSEISKINSQNSTPTSLFKA